jgi:hypothetical protein
MDITRKGSEVFIEGNIKTIGDFQAIKECLDPIITPHMQLHIVIKNSISMTSSVIGYFTKLVLKDKVNMSLSIEDADLAQLLDDLGVSQLLHVRTLG